MSSIGWCIQRLAKTHQRQSFDCGVPILNTYLQERAGQEMRRRLAVPYVLTKDDHPDVLGYYTLSAASIPLDELPEDTAKQARYERVPTMLIGRLAIDQSLAGQGWGTKLLMDALSRIHNITEAGVMLVAVEAKDKTAKAFYQRLGFISLKSQPNHLFLPVKSIPQ